MSSKNEFKKGPFRPAEEPTNADRAEWADDALQGFADATGIDEIDDQRQFVAAQDLMANIMHLFDSRGLDFEAALSGARMHYEDELAEESEAIDEAGPVGIPGKIIFTTPVWDFDRERIAPNYLLAIEGKPWEGFEREAALAFVGVFTERPTDTEEAVHEYEDPETGYIWCYWVGNFSEGAKVATGG